MAESNLPLQRIYYFTFHLNISLIKIILLVILFIYISNLIPIPSFPSTNSHSYPKSPSLYVGVPPPNHPLLPHRPNISLCWVIEPPQDQWVPLPQMPDIHMQLDPCVCFAWWFSSSKLCMGFWTVDIVVLPMGLQTLQLLQIFPNSIVVPALSPIGSRVHPHLYCSGYSRASEGTKISGSRQQAFIGISNNVWVWCLQIGWMPKCLILWMSFPSVSSILCPCISSRDYFLPFSE